MKKSKKIAFITNFILILTIFSVFAVFFVPMPTQTISGGEEISAIYNGNKEKRNVSLMFNVYENSGVVCDILDVLKKYNAKATFFIGGCWADDNVETLIKIRDSGNEIANHGYYHKDHKSLDYNSNLSEINNTDSFIRASCGIKPTLFAPPSGSFSNQTLKACYDLGYKVIMWSKDTIDWRDKDQNKVFFRATNQLSCGDLILMHPKTHTLNALPSIIEYCLKLDFNLVSVSDNIAD